MAQAVATTAEMDIGDGLKLEADGRVTCDKRTAVEADVKVRDDLSPKHPLYLSRAVRCVPSGMPDCTIVDGKLVPIEVKPPAEEPKPDEEALRER